VALYHILRGAKLRRQSIDADLENLINRFC